MARIDARAGHRRFVVARLERPVAFARAACTSASAIGTDEVVVERGRERRCPLTGLDGADPVADPVQEVLDAGVGLRRVLQRGLGELEHRPVVRAAEVVAQLGGPNPLQHSGNGQHVAERLAHLLATHGDPAVVQPEPGERVADGFGLGDLVLVVREDQVHSAAWMSNSAPRYASHIATHSVCQPGRPRPHGVGHDGSPGFSPFHRVKSRWSRLPVATPSP